MCPHDWVLPLVSVQSLGEEDAFLRPRVSGGRGTCRIDGHAESMDTLRSAMLSVKPRETGTQPPQHTHDNKCCIVLNH